jgi:primase-polymerase (primpol)-like protein
MDFPEKLKKLNNWVIHLDKIPYTPGTNQRASVSNSKTWRSYLEASTSCQNLRCMGAGLGFVFSPFDNLIGIDLDHCVKDGLIERWADEIIYNINSYTEFSFSGTGFHIILESGKLPDGFGTGKRRKDPNVEIYSGKQYFTMTGNVFNKVSKEVENRETELWELIKEYKLIKELPQKIISTTRSVFTDSQILSKASKSKNGKKFMSLWNGNFSNYKSQSEADIALCRILAFWSNGNSEQIDRLFRQSKLMRDCWDLPKSSETYGMRTIRKSLG